jgi:O-antigen/teichoic acid export membrane protein
MSEMVGGTGTIETSALQPPAVPASARSASTRRGFRRLGRDTLAYTLGVVLSRAVGFVMLPVYTRFLTPTDYGILQLLEMTTDLACIVFLAGMNSGVERFFFKAGTAEERARVIFSAYALEMGLSVLATLALVFGAHPIWKYALHGAGSPAMVKIAAVNFTLAMMLAMPLLFAQTQQRSFLYAATNLSKLILQLSLNIFFIVGLGLHATGVLLSGLIANGIIGGILAVWLVRQTGAHLSGSIIRDLRRFGIPYQITTAGTFILTFGDRYFLQASHSVGEVGIYGLGYQFGFLLQQITAAPYMRAWSPQRYQLVNEAPAVRDPIYRRGVLYLNLILLTVATGMCLFIRPVIQIMTTAPFHGAAEIVPVIAAAYVVQSWTDVAKLGIDVSEQTKYVTYATWTAVVLILVLYATLIPPFGGMGAAVATLIGFSARTSLIYFWSQRLWYIDYRLREQAPLLAIATAASVAGYVSPVHTILGELALGTLVFAGYCALVWRLVLGPAERQVLREVLRRPRQGLAALTQTR